MGSNSGKEENFLFARKHLKELFPSIVFGDEILSEPFNISNDSLFLNQVAKFDSELTLEVVHSKFKCLELLSGRTSENTAKGIVTLDIDILKYDDTVLKAEDMNRQYIIDGLKTLKQT